MPLSKPLELLKPLPEQTYKNDFVSFLQSDFWAEFKGRHGWQYKRFLCNTEGQDVSLTVLYRKLAKIFYLAYIPMGPVFQEGNKIDAPAILKQIAKEVAKDAKKHLDKPLLCVRFDPPVDCKSIQEKNTVIKLYQKVLKKTKVDIQPPDTVLLDLRQDTEAILRGMKSKTRYNIKLATKKGVCVHCYTTAKSTPQEMQIALEQFYDIFLTTAKRDGIAIHSKEYYKDLFLCATENAQPCLYLATHEKDVLCGIIVLFCKNQSVYLYGASSNIKRNFMATYLLQWQAIKDAKAFGSLFYDFYGIPPTSDPRHPMHGLYQFKTGFNGTIIYRPGSFDFPCCVFYGLFVLLEDIRAFWHKKVKKIAKKIIR